MPIGAVSKTKEETLALWSLEYMTWQRNVKYEMKFMYVYSGCVEDQRRDINSPKDMTEQWWFYLSDRLTNSYAKKFARES